VGTNVFEPRHSSRRILEEFKDGKGVDFFQARGYISFEATKHINLQFGHDRFLYWQRIQIIDILRLFAASLVYKRRSENLEA
jgi:hypothetical protein